MLCLLISVLSVALVLCAISHSVLVALQQKIMFYLAAPFWFWYPVYHGIWDRECEVSFDDSFGSQIFFGRSSPKSKAVGGLPASHKECRSFCKLFLILSLVILSMEKFTFSNIITDPMAKDKRSFVLATYFCFSALSKSSHSLIILAIAFTTEALQFWDILSASFTQLGTQPCCYCRKSPYSMGAYFSTISWG